MNKIMTSPPTIKEEAQALLSILGFGENAYSKFQPDCKPTLPSDPKKQQFQFSCGTLDNNKLLNKSSRKLCSNPCVSWSRQDVRYVPYTTARENSSTGTLCQKAPGKTWLNPRFWDLGIHRKLSPLYSNWKTDTVSLRKGLSWIGDDWYWRAAPLGILTASAGLDAQRTGITQQAQETSVAQKS